MERGISSLAWWERSHVDDCAATVGPQAASVVFCWFIVVLAFARLARKTCKTVFYCALNRAARDSGTERLYVSGF